MLTSFAVSVCPYTQAGLPAPAGDAEGRNPARNGGQNPDGVRLKAQAAVDKATGLWEKQTGKDLRAAIALLQQSVLLFKAVPDYSQAADGLLQIGEIYFTLSQYDRALKSYREALNLDGKRPELVCLALSRVARAYAITGQQPSADSYSSQALSRCGALPDPRLQAEGLDARGEALYTAGDSAGAAELLLRARDLFAQAKDENGQAQALLMLAYANFSGDRLKATQFAGQALQLWSSSRDGSARTHTALGLLAAVAGEFGTSQCNYQDAVTDFQTIGDKDSEATALNGMGFASWERGDLEASLKSYRLAKAIFAGIPDQLGTLETITGMGKTLTSMGRYRKLLPLYQEKLRLLQQTGTPAQAASALADMAGVYELEHQYAKAETFYQRSLAAYRSAQNEHGEGDVLIHLARFQAGQGRYAEAISFLENARRLEDKTGQVENVARIQYELAYIYRRLDRLEDARAAIEQTIKIIESQRLKIASFDSRASYFAFVHRYYALYIQLLMLQHRQDPERGLMRLAFEASERSKVRAFLDLLSASSQGLPCKDLLQRQLAVADSTDAHAADVEQAESATSVLTLQEIQAEIEHDDTVLLEYSLGDEKSYVWVVDQKQIVLHELPHADQIWKLVQLFRNALTARQPLPGESSLGLDAYQKRVHKAELAYPLYARQLSQLLLAPLSLDQKTRVLIVPDGPLQYIPFAALPLPQTGDNNALLVSHHEVIILPSASALSTLRRAAANRAPPTFAAAVVANPVFEHDDPRLSAPGASGSKELPGQPSALTIALRGAQGSQHIIRLPGSHEEARIIRQTLTGQNVLVVEGFAANRSFVLNGALNGYRILHFATHGIIDALHPEMSGLILSLIDRRGRQQDGYLRLGDVYKLKLSADLVVLSGCNSALGKDLESEGIIGLPRGFLYAGARSVIASLWKVDDAAAAEFMKGLYERIQRGESPSSALRGAQLKMLHGRRWSEPFYWAAFVLQGDYN
jgi:CHAT domain-containing protein